MRVVIDGRYLCGRPSGIGQYVRALVSRLPALAPELEFRIWTGPDWAPEQAPRDVQLRPIRAKSNSLATLCGLRRLDRLSPNDVFHATANVLGFGLPCPSVVTVHDTMWLDCVEECQPNRFLRPISRVYFRTGIMRALRKASRVVTVSEASAKAIERVDAATSRRLRVIHHGFEASFCPPDAPETAKQAARQILGLDGDFLLVVGQNQPSKGHAVALRALARCSNQRTQLVFVQRLGTGGELREMARAAGMANRVRFVAELEGEGLIAVMQSALAILQPSYGEGFGLPVLEAAACGCPVIASNIEALQEVLGDAAIYAEVGDIEAWRRAIDNLVASPELRASLR